MDQSAAQTRDEVSFGPFSLVASERRLTREGAALPLGGRALDILIALISRPNQAIGKRDLMAQVWPDVTVGEGSLRFHIAELRKALGDGRDGARYIATLAGRGYCFVAPISRPSDRSGGEAELVPEVPLATLPNRLVRMVGRTDGILMLASQLTAARFVTIVGAGGVGKTTVAVAVAHDLIEKFAGAAFFIDLGAIGDPKMVAISLAALLGVSIRSDDPTPSLIVYLRDKRILLVLDNCEHLSEAVAALAERIFVAAPEVHILATSREPLRVEGEHVYRLAPLAFPQEELGLSAADAMTFPAIQLFVERAAASGASLDLTDGALAIVADICRKLDGVALAIELAAGRVATYGLQQTAALLEERLSLLWQGQRTAPPRQQTLKATLDWSFGLLSALERKVLRYFAIFAGNFTLEAARAVLKSPSIEQDLILGAIDSLVAKSMVATNRVGMTVRYRLMDTTRAYALEIGLEDAELAELAARHASHYRQWLEQTLARWPAQSGAADRSLHFADLANARAALEWCFGANGNAEIGVGLASAAAPVFLAMSLLTECHRWSERALHALDDGARGGVEEMHLQAALGLSLILTRGSADAARAAMALHRSLAIAEERGDTIGQLQLVAPLQMLHIRLGEFETALRYARHSIAVAATTEEPAALALAHSLLGNSLHFIGDLSGARAALEAALRAPRSPRASTIYLGFDHHNRASITLARTLWLQGYPAQAVECARKTVADAVSIDHPMTLYLARIWAVPIFLWTGDLKSAEEHTEQFIAHAETHSLGPYVAVGRGFKGELAIRLGHPKRGVESLMGCLDELHTARYEPLTTTFNIALVQGLAVIGQLAESITLVDETIRLVTANGDLLYMPELLRVKGGVLISMPQPRPGEAEACFMQSIDWSRRQGATAWELRTATNLAALWAGQGRPDKARALLRPVLDRFTEGSETTDLKIADRLLLTLE